MFINSFGDTNIIAAFTATEHIEKLLHQPYNSISAALTTFAGLNYGAENIRRVGLSMLAMLIPRLLFWGIWWTAGLTWSISALFCMLRYFSWYRKAKTQQPRPDAASAGF